MYHCKLTFYFTGGPCGAFAVIRQMPPMEHFSHSFLETPQPETDPAAGADVIVFHYGCAGDGDGLRLLIERKSENAQLIVLADRERIPQLSAFFAKITDIWTLPMADDEVRFRFLRWQQTCKLSRDHWETSQFLASTINSVPNLIWYKTRDGIHEKVNDSFCRTVNKTKAQVEGRDHFYIWDVEPDGPASNGHDCTESDMEVIRSQKTCVAEETVLSGDEMKLLTTYKTPLYDLDGSVMGTVGIGIDITQERAYKQEIVQKNLVLEAIFSSVDCGILCHSLDGKHIIRVNKTALRILGYETSEELAASFDKVAQSVFDEDKVMLQSAMERLEKEGDSVSVEYSVQHKDGSVIHVMGNIKLLQENGELFYQRFLLDCTEQKRQERENAKRQEELIQALSTDYVSVFLLDLDSGSSIRLRVDGNHESLLSSLPSEISFMGKMERYIQQYVHEDDKESMLQLFSADRLTSELNAKKQMYVNYRLVANGRMEYYEIKIVKTSTWEENHSAILGFRSVDEETRRKMDEKLLLETALVQANSANKAKSMFLSNMSHDIRTPMNAIMGFANLAIAKADSQEVVRDYLSKILSSGKLLLSLINNVLDISQIESGKLELTESLCDLTEFLDEIQLPIQTDLHTKQLDFSIETDIVNKVIYCDRLQLRRVFLNVIGNSIKYTEPGGTIRVRITEKTGKAADPTGYANYKIRIQDTGIGMSSEFVSHIFEIFDREQNTTSSGIEGNGLGMAITKNIVDMMNGTIHVNSEKNVGTEVIIDISFRIGTEHGEKGVPNLQESGADIHLLQNPAEGMHTRILLVEDNPLNQEIAAEILKTAGFETDLAENGKIAVEMLERSEPGYYKLILMDIQMPVMNGYDAARAIRRLDNKQLASIPILAMTANAFATDEQEALKSGMNGHLSKPIDIQKLFAMLHRY